MPLKQRDKIKHQFVSSTEKSIEDEHFNDDSRPSKRQRRDETVSWLSLADLVLEELHREVEDSIQACGTAVLDLLEADTSTVLEIAHENLHTWPYKQVPLCWRRLYEDASLYKAVSLLKQDDHRDLAEVVRVLDMGIALSGQPRRRDLFVKIFNVLDDTDYDISGGSFLLQEPGPLLGQQLVVRSPPLAFDAFQEHLDTKNTPIVILGLIDIWPALQKWQSSDYLLARTLGGHRLVPVEIGSSYTDHDWTQKLMPFKEYLNDYIVSEGSAQTGYLAQHDLLTQIPALLADISIPDYCWSIPPPAPANIPIHPGQLEEPQINAWFGPKGTKSPLHTDPYYNILCQVVGYKYVRLYAPEQSARLYARGTNEAGINMANTSQLDLAFGGSNLENWPLAIDAAYQEVILAPGECLFIPAGWWHFIESLSISFSVSFWWN